MLIFSAMNGSRLAAELVLITHVAFIAFVLGGLIVTWTGIFCGWRWVRGFGFRAAHLLAIGFVVVQAYFGIVCPLTVLENNLRVRGGQEAYGPRGFITHWLHNLIFFDAPSWVFTLCYTLFGLLVLGTLLLAPPHRPRWWRARRATTAAQTASSSA
ncbi:MAG: hypothetical protein QOF78_519 [Phycisphaerales bacterium]|jgi:hypothetical protein|nr:hypothetical protein [Phycisphaerales bacterium]